MLIVTVLLWALAAFALLVLAWGFLRNLNTIPAIKQRLDDALKATRTGVPKWQVIWTFWRVYVFERRAEGVIRPFMALIALNVTWRVLTLRQRA